MHAEWTQVSETEWVFTIQADRFLRNMVRAVVGTLIEVGRGKLSIEGFRQVIEKRIDAVPEAQCRDTLCFWSMWDIRKTCSSCKEEIIAFR